MITMKKIITLVICLGIISFSFAQYRNDDRDNAYVYKSQVNNSHYWGGREFQIQKINRAFDAKIFAIEHDWTLRPYQQRVAIRALERERRREIRIAQRSRHHANVYRPRHYH